MKTEMDKKGIEKESRKEIGYDCSCCDFAEKLPNKGLQNDFVYCCNPDCEFHYHVEMLEITHFSMWHFNSLKISESEKSSIKLCSLEWSDDFSGNFFDVLFEHFHCKPHDDEDDYPIEESNSKNKNVAGRT